MPHDCGHVLAMNGREAALSHSPLIAHWRHDSSRSMQTVVQTPHELCARKQGRRGGRARAQTA